MSPATVTTLGEPACLHFAAAASTAAASRSVSSSFAPCWAKPSAAASPMPLAAPARPIAFKQDWQSTNGWLDAPVLMGLEKKAKAKLAFGSNHHEPYVVPAACEHAHTYL